MKCKNCVFYNESIFPVPYCLNNDRVVDGDKDYCSWGEKADGR